MQNGLDEAVLYETLLEQYVKVLKKDPATIKVDELPTEANVWIRIKKGQVHEISREELEDIMKELEEKLLSLRKEPVEEDELDDLIYDEWGFFEGERRYFIDDMVSDIEMILKENLKSDGTPDLSAIGHGIVAGWFMQRYKLLTRPDGTIYYYYKGKWVEDAESLIQKDLELAFLKANVTEKVTNNFVGEVLGHIRRMTYATDLRNPPWLLNLKNGVLDLRTLEIHPHSPKYKFFYQLPVEYDPDAKAPVFEKFLSEVVEEEDARVLQEFIGYIFLPDCRYEKALMLVGSGSNGKSTFLKTIVALLGKENISNLSIQELVNDRFKRAELFGKLANIYPDLPSTAMAETGVFKVLVSGEMITAERKFRDPFTFENRAKLLFSANKLPYTSDDSLAFYRRWIIINFPNEFKGKRKDPRLVDKLTTPEELSGILNWALEGLHRLLEQDGFSYNLDVEEIQKYYERMSSSIAAFVQDVLEEAPESKISKDQLYQVYREYCKANKLIVESKTKFGRDLPRYINVESTKSGSVRYWIGVRISEEWASRALGLSSKEEGLDKFVGGGGI